MKHLIIGGIIILIVGGVLFIAFRNLLDGIINRFNDDRATAGGGRIELWTYYLQQFSSSIKTILVGSKPSVMLYAERSVLDIEHNTFIQMIYELGIIGSLIYLVCLFLPAQNIKARFHKKRNPRSVIYCLPIFGAIAPYFFLSALTGENFCLTLAFAMFVYVLFSRSQNDINSKTHTKMLYAGGVYEPLRKTIN